MSRFLPGRLNRRWAAFSLIEVVVALVILVMLAVAAMTSVAYITRSSRVNANAFAARNIALGYFERMTRDTFASVGLQGSGLGRYANIAYTDNVWLDQALNIPCRVDFLFKGFGTATAGSVNDLTDTRAAWTANEWAGDTLFLVAGTGKGQSVAITSNTANKLTFASKLDFAPDVTTKYMVNNGKTVIITVTWQYQGTTCPTQTFRALITDSKYRTMGSNLGYADLGF